VAESSVESAAVRAYAILTACCTLLAIISGAALTSSKDLVFQTPHTIVAIVDSILIVGLCVWRRAGWTSLGLLVADAILGKFQGPVWGTLHAILAALLFTSIAAVVLFTSSSWQRDPDQVQDYGRPSLRSLSTAAVLLIVMQVGFGAGLRHSAVGVMPHLLGALVVALFIMIVGVFVTTQFPKHAALRRMAVAFMVITGIQVLLGMGAFFMRMMNTSGSTVFLAISVAHVTTGSLTLATGVMLALEIRRSVLPRAAAA
jgi:hypothetical protein